MKKKGTSPNQAMAKKQMQQIMSIHRHWIWADRMKKEFYNRLGAAVPTLTQENVHETFVEEWGMYMCLWYGLLFAVIQGLEAANFTIPDIKPDLSEIRVALKSFRNAVFHVQPEYWSPKLFDIMENESSPIKIKEVHDKIGAWLLNEIRSRQSKNEKVGTSARTSD